MTWTEVACTCNAAALGLCWRDMATKSVRAYVSQVHSRLRRINRLRRNNTTLTVAYDNFAFTFAPTSRVQIHPTSVHTNADMVGFRYNMHSSPTNPFILHLCLHPKASSHPGRIAASKTVTALTTMQPASQTPTDLRCARAGRRWAFAFGLGQDGENEIGDEETMKSNGGL